MGVSF
ncbi:hypothetical protein BCIN_16g03080 [Botrytis cinerea B05.10]